MCKDVKVIAIAGAGTMGASMAETFAKFGYHVVLCDVSNEAIDKAMNSIRINQLTEVGENIITQEESEALLKRIQYTTDIQRLNNVDFLIEAIIENMDAKLAFWSEASRIVKETAILASNTSGLSITKIAEAIKKPGRFAGMHWINPPHIIPLIEVIKGEKTEDKTVEKIYEICELINKKPVIVKDAPGFVLNRIQLAVLRECLNIVEKGIASPEDVDKVMKYALGIRYACLGPFEVVDHGGIDIFHHIANYLFEDLSTEKESFYLLKEYFEDGRLGVKTQKGFYDYSDGKDEEATIYRDQLYTKIVKCLFE